MFPSVKVIGFVGGGHASNVSAANVVLGPGAPPITGPDGQLFYGGSYVGMAEAMNPAKELVASTALALSMTIPNPFSPELLHLDAQYSKLRNLTDWQGENRLKALVISFTGEGLMVPFDALQAGGIDGLIERTRALVDRAEGDGLIVKLDLYPDYDDIDLQKFADTYNPGGFVPTREYWDAVRGAYLAEFQDNIVDVWKGDKYKPFDGLHPTFEGARRAANKMRRAIDES